MTESLGPQAQRVYDVLVNELANGAYGPGARLPSHAALARRFGVAVMTARQAVARLETEGIVRCEQGRGTFVLGPGGSPAGSPSRSLISPFAAFALISHDAIITTDASGTIRSWNKGASHMFGYAEDEALGQPLTVLMPERFRQAHTLGLRRFQLGGRGRLIGQTTELVGCRKDGSEFPLELSLDASEVDGARYACAIIRDISARRAAEQLRLSQDAQQRLLAESTLANVIEAAPLPIITIDWDGRVTSWNRAAEQVLGWTAAEALGRRLPTVPEDEWESFMEVHLRVLHGEMLAGLERSRRRKDGRAIDIVIWTAPQWDTQGNVIGVIAIYEDVTERKSAEAAVRASEERYRRLVEASLDGILTLNTVQRVTFANGRAVAMFGYDTVEQMLGKPGEELTQPEDRTEIANQSRRLLTTGTMRGLLHRCTRRDGSIFPAEVSAVLLYDDAGRPAGTMAVIRDVTDQMAYEERLEHQALHDALTDLPNRTLLLDRLERAMLVAARERGTFALLLLDLDHFKEVNDTFGHQFGDLLLQQLTTRLSSSLRESDTVARLGGDEFAILLPSTDDAGAALAAGKIMGALRAPFPIQEQQIALSGSIGIVLFPQHGRDVHTLLRRADIAMYTAKRSRGGYAIYSSEEDRHSSSLLGLMGELRTALAKNQLALFFQPQVVLATQQVIGVEALIRWQHPTQGLLLPERFLLLAEQTGLIHELGRWVLAAAARTAREWEAGGLDLSIAVNLSAHNFHDPQFAAELATLLAVQPTLASRLTLEITETAVMANAARALDLLGELHDLGVRIAIDDFGTGYSSLSYLKRLPVDELKIDRAFVHDLTTNDESQFIAQSVIDLGHKLRLDIVAEGAEDEQTCELLAAMGCDRVQGYAVAAPLARDALITWLRHHRTARLLVG